ncbi:MULTISPECIES: hypothetical protein [unclassified Campylobacter]|uniref:hypothetical protein n=1 Tax=unclassified Campylobacter TaxID=2593542 RepID=UPI0022E9EFBC|nr:MULTISPECIES: hypothetical protein [unclassified Campylobacter]MDA3062161.1 hypothetical protein [Campylobacter sp. JMF_14 EL1]MDA3072735.1 hypothetical protein [Campylobacter sp. JMF_10 EL2]
MAQNKKTLWPYGIAFSIVAIIAACVATIIFSLDYPVHSDNFYFDKYQKVDENYNEIQISQAKFDEKYKIFISDFSSSGDENFVVLAPKNDTLINELNFDKKFLNTFRENGFNAQNLLPLAPNYEISRGNKFSFKIAFKPSFDKIHAQIRLSRPETNEFDRDLSVRFQDNFLIVDQFEIPKEGRWQVVARLEDGQNVGFYKFEFIGVKK